MQAFGLLELYQAARAMKRLLEALVVERFDEIIECCQVERLQRVLIVGGDENRRRHFVGSDRACDLEASFAWHLHVEKKKIGIQRPNRVDGSRACAGRTDDLDIRLTREKILDALARERLVAEWYYTTSDDPADKVAAMGSIVPDTVRNVAGLQNAVAFLVETRGIGLGHLHVQRRVHTQVTAVSSLLASTAGRAADLVKLRGYLDAAIPAQACQGEATISASPTRSEHRLTLLDPLTGADKSLTVDWDSALTLQPRITRARPCGYWLAADMNDAVRRLRALGVQVQQFAQNASAQGDEYRGATSAAAGAPLQLVDALIDLPAGSYYVPLTQPLANLVMAALEPNGPASYVEHGVIADASRIARVRVPPEATFSALP